MMTGELDFETGKLHCVGPTSRKKEWILLAIVLPMTAVPYFALCWYRPAAGVTFFVTILIFKVVIAYMSSAQGGLSHHIRFLLAGSNPFGMVGAASMMLGAVDSILDWREDTAERRKNRVTFLWTTLVKFLTAPIGLAIFLCELAWDAILGRGPKMWKAKCSEFFALARYHDLICPEKSNDLFYSDLAYARYTDNLLLYQWNRMRAMVFELQHYRLDIENGIGSRETNLFRVGDVAAYQIIKRLKLAEIQAAIVERYEKQPEQFPLPRRLADQLVKNARPIDHYLRMRAELAAEGLLPPNETDFERELEQHIPRESVWQTLYAIDNREVYNVASGDNLGMEKSIDERASQIAELANESCEEIDEAEHLKRMRRPIPSSLKLPGRYFAFEKASLP